MRTKMQRKLVSVFLLRLVDKVGAMTLVIATES